MKRKFLKKIIDRISTEVNYAFFRRYRFARTVRRHLAQFYTDFEPEPTNESKMIVYMADGALYRSGLADRIRGILSLYYYCKTHNLDFRINFTDPFPLERFLLPAKYDWQLKAGELTKNKRYSIPIYVDTREAPGERERRWQEATFDRYFSKDFRQAHVYTNFDQAKENFSQLFNELFRVSPVFQRNLDEATSRLGRTYISVSTRFLELLGDFVEPKPIVTPLSETESNKLIALCLSKIREIHQSECREGEKILVTSDSMKFLKEASKLEFVEIIEGKVSHFSVEMESREESDMKTMVDFFAISRARKSFLLISGDMYPSNFSKRAAQIGNHEFVEVKF